MLRVLPSLLCNSPFISGHPARYFAKNNNKEPLLAGNCAEYKWRTSFAAAISINRSSPSSLMRVSLILSRAWLANFALSRPYCRSAEIPTLLFSNIPAIRIAMRSSWRRADRTSISKSLTPLSCTLSYFSYVGVGIAIMSGTIANSEIIASFKSSSFIKARSPSSRASR